MQSIVLSPSARDVLRRTAGEEWVEVTEATRPSRPRIRDGGDHDRSGQHLSRARADLPIHRRSLGAAIRIPGMRLIEVDSFRH
jgi:hypothetical protein